MQILSEQLNEVLHMYPPYKHTLIKIQNISKTPEDTPVPI